MSPITQNHRHGATVEQVVRGIQRAGEVHALILPHFYLRRDKGLIAAEVSALFLRDVDRAKLPRKRDLVVLCPLARRQGAVYKRIIESEGTSLILGEPSSMAQMWLSSCRPRNRVNAEVERSEYYPASLRLTSRRSACCHQVNSVGDDLKSATLKM